MSHLYKLISISCLALALTIAQPVSAESAVDDFPMLINHGIDGSWVSSEANSQGLIIETLPSSNTMVIFWFTFNEAGGEREWYIGLGDINGAVAELSISRVAGGQFGQISETMELASGTARIEFTDCTNAIFDFDLSLHNLAGSNLLHRLTPDAGCLEQREQAHVTFVTRLNNWLNAQGTWVFNECVELGPTESHGREDLVFDGATMSLEIQHYNAAGCQGPVDVQLLEFGLTRIDKVKADLGGEQVIVNRVLLEDPVSGAVAKQILYFDTSVNPAIMTHGVFDGALDADGYPATLHSIFATPQL